jgi:hypothetical protein
MITYFLHLQYEDRWLRRTVETAKASLIDAMNLPYQETMRSDVVIRIMPDGMGVKIKDRYNACRESVSCDELVMIALQAENV